MSREVRKLEPYFGQQFEPRQPRFRNVSQESLDLMAPEYRPVSVESITHPLVPYVGFDTATLMNGIGYRLSDATLAQASKTQLKPHIHPRDLMDIVARNNPTAPQLPRQAMDAMYDMMGQLLTAAAVSQRRETTLFIVKSCCAALAIVNYRVEHTMETPLDAFYLMCTDAESRQPVYDIVPSTFSPRVNVDYAMQLIVPGRMDIPAAGVAGAVPMLAFVLPKHVGTIVIVDRRYSPVSPALLAGIAAVASAAVDAYDPYKPG